MVDKALFSNGNDDWETPEWLLDMIVKNWGNYYDPCPLKHNIRKWDGLELSWPRDQVVYVNPPYSKCKQWINKCIQQYKRGCKIVLLIPARTDTKYFHKLMNNCEYQIYFLKGRLKFGDSKNTAPFPSVIIYIDKNIGAYSGMAYFEDWQPGVE